MELIPLIDIVFETDRLAVRRWRNSNLTRLKAVYGVHDLAISEF
jgi:hypothetical protein